MPDEAIALSTSKRKFDRLLDNLSNTPTSSSSSLRDRYKSDAKLKTALSKKPRLSFEIERMSDENSSPTTTPGFRPDTPEIPQKSPTKSIRAVFSGRDKPGVTESESIKNKANFMPWNRDTFLDRLETFHEPRVWTNNKPNGLHAVEWAKRGWSADEAAWNTVVCKGGCDERVCVRLYPKRRDNIGDFELDKTENTAKRPPPDLIEKYKELIVTGHRDGCAWRDNKGCGDDVHRVPMIGESWKKDLIQRYNSLVAIKESIPPSFDTKNLPKVSQVRDAAPQFLLDAIKASSKVAHDVEDDDNDTQLNESALYLAVTGWSGNTNPIAFAECRTCFARLAIWTFPKMRTPTKDYLLHPLKEHNWYCPWTNAESQCGVGSWSGLTASEILWKVLDDQNNRKKRLSGAAVNTEEAESTTVDDESTSLATTTTQSRAPSREEIEKEDKVRSNRLSAIRKTLNFKRFSHAKKKSVDTTKSGA